MYLLIVGLLAITGVLSVLLIQTRRRSLRLQRENFIRSYVFSSDLLFKLKKNHPHLEEADIFLVARALREFFIIHGRAGPRLIGMPSRVTDDLWHEFILDTSNYQLFCRKAFGDYFHHIPASVTVKGVDIHAGLRVTWKYACLEENINPNNPTRLPLLFAIDQKLKIENGNTYTLKTESKAASEAGGCGGAACGGGFDGSDAGFSGDGGGCSGGCGGGCGGG